MEDQQPPEAESNKPQPAAAEDSAPEIDETEAVPEQKQPKKSKLPGGHWWHRRRLWYTSHKKWSIPATIIILLLIVATVPWSRYHVAGLILKKDFTVEVTDSTAGTPVSGASVSIGGTAGITNGSGKVTLHHIAVGQCSVNISKKYYTDKHAGVLVPILKQKNIPVVPIVATGRQVKIDINNLINKQKVAGATITVAGIVAKTDNSGSALIVLPAGTSSQKATLSADGYNDAEVTVLVSNSAIKENDFNITPSGKVYFFSTRAGQLDVMKANLDGTSADVAVAGTGNESVTDSQISQSPDGKYVAAVEKRNANDPTPQVYVLAAADDKLLNVDASNAIFLLQGWAGDNLVYTLQRQDLPSWQNGTNKLKSYDATSGKTTLLDQSSAAGDATASVNEYFAATFLSGTTVIYAKSWTQTYVSAPPPAALLSGKQNTLVSISTDGQNHKVVASYDAVDSVQYVQHGPDELYIWDQSAKDASSDQFFDYTFGATAAKQISTLSSAQFYAGVYSYFAAPSGKQTFWSEPRDGKYALVLADGSGASPKTIANLSDYSAYGWYTDNYLLVTKSGSELYVSDTRGDKPIKITDYQNTFGSGI